MLEIGYVDVEDLANLLEVFVEVLVSLGLRAVVVQRQTALVRGGVLIVRVYALSEVVRGLPHIFYFFFKLVNTT